MHAPATAFVTPNESSARLTQSEASQTVAQTQFAATAQLQHCQSSADDDSKKKKRLSSSALNTAIAVEPRDVVNQICSRRGSGASHCSLGDEKATMMDDANARRTRSRRLSVLLQLPDQRKARVTNYCTQRRPSAVSKNTILVDDAKPSCTSPREESILAPQRMWSLESDNATSDELYCDHLALDQTRVVNNIQDATTESREVPTSLGILRHHASSQSSSRLLGGTATSHHGPTGEEETDDYVSVLSSDEWTTEEEEVDGSATDDEENVDDDECEDSQYGMGDDNQDHGCHRRDRLLANNGSGAQILSVQHEERKKKKKNSCVATPEEESRRENDDGDGERYLEDEHGSNTVEDAASEDGESEDGEREDGESEEEDDPEESQQQRRGRQRCEEAEPVSVAMIHTLTSQLSALTCAVGKLEGNFAPLRETMMHIGVSVEKVGSASEVFKERDRKDEQRHADIESHRTVSVLEALGNLRKDVSDNFRCVYTALAENTKMITDFLGESRDAKSATSLMRSSAVENRDAAREQRVSGADHHQRGSAHGSASLLNQHSHCMSPASSQSSSSSSPRSSSSSSVSSVSPDRSPTPSPRAGNKPSTTRPIPSPNASDLVVTRNTIGWHEEDDDDDDISLRGTRKKKMPPPHGRNETSQDIRLSDKKGRASSRSDTSSASSTQMDKRTRKKHSVSDLRGKVNEGARHVPGDQRAISLAQVDRHSNPPEKRSRGASRKVKEQEIGRGTNGSADLDGVSGVRSKSTPVRMPTSRPTETIVSSKSGRRFQFVEFPDDDVLASAARRQRSSNAGQDDE